MCQSFISILNFIRHSTLVGQCSMKPLSSIRPSVCPLSLRPSLKFFKMRSLAFSDIAYDDSRPWYLVTNVARFWARRAKIGHGFYFFFGNFLRFGVYVFFEITYHDSLQQFIMSNRGKTHEKKFGEANLGQTSQNRIPT